MPQIYQNNMLGFAGAQGGIQNTQSGVYSNSGSQNGAQSNQGGQFGSQFGAQSLYSSQHGAQLNLGDQYGAHSNLPVGNQANYQAGQFGFSQAQAGFDWTSGLDEQTVMDSLNQMRARFPHLFANLVNPPNSAAGLDHNFGMYSDPETIERVRAAAARKALPAIIPGFKANALDLRRGCMFMTVMPCGRVQVHTLFMSTMPVQWDAGHTMFMSAMPVQWDAGRTMFMSAMPVQWDAARTMFMSAMPVQWDAGAYYAYVRDAHPVGPIPPRIDDLFKAGRYIPYTSLSSSARLKALQGEEEVTFNAASGSFTAKSVDRQNKKTILPID
ncbi:hypothetical protein B0H14DRAFT_3438608 [Mycena olivaceomarginata]|nr:hypothetical protein B0H14DRAFT_3438608 [Mycena olivaceomarginata]